MSGLILSSRTVTWFQRQRYLIFIFILPDFSYTFDKVQEKSEILWKFNYYAVVYEHYDRPYFPLIGTIVDIVRAMKCSERCISKDDSNDFRKCSA